MHDLSIPVKSMALWPQYMFVTRYRDWPFIKTDLVDAVNILAEEQEHRIQSGISERTKTQGLIESDLHLFEKKDRFPVLKKLQDFFEEAVLDVVTHALPLENPQTVLPANIDPKVVITNCWYHKTNNGGSHGVHSHPGNSWAGIFYVQSSECSVSKDNGVNRFYNVEASKGIGDVGSMWHNNNCVFDVSPTEGNLVIFPAWLHHEGRAYTGSEDRIVISFNSLTLDKHHANNR